MKNEWILVKHVLNDNYLCHKDLITYRGVILVTYETRTKRRHVKAVRCNYGRLSSKEIKDDILAFMFLPEPYEG